MLNTHSSKVGDATFPDPQARVFSLSDVASNSVKQMVRGLITQRVQIAVDRNGKMDYHSIAANAFGTALGNSIVGQLKFNALPDDIKQKSPQEIAQFEQARAAANQMYPSASGEDLDGLARSLAGLGADRILGAGDLMLADSGEFATVAGQGAGSSLDGEVFGTPDDRTFISHTLALARGGWAEPEDILRMQRMLSETGFALGTTGDGRDGVDGGFGPRTDSAALRYLQMDSDLLTQRADVRWQMYQNLSGSGGFIDDNDRSTSVELNGHAFVFNFGDKFSNGAISGGYSPAHAIFNTDVGAYMAVMDAASSVADAGSSVTIGITGAWRPKRPEDSPAHPAGRGLDIGSVTLTASGVTNTDYFVAMDRAPKDGSAVSGEPDLARMFTNALWQNRSNTGVNQFIGPWRLVPKGGTEIRDNAGDNRVNNHHDDHLHVGGGW